MTKAKIEYELKSEILSTEFMTKLNQMLNKGIVISDDDANNQPIDIDILERKTGITEFLNIVQSELSNITYKVNNAQYIANIQLDH